MEIVKLVGFIKIVKNSKMGNVFNALQNILLTKMDNVQL